MIQSILILYSFPLVFMPDGSPDHAVQQSVLSRLQSVEAALHRLGHSTKALEVTDNLLELVQEIQSGRENLVFNLCEEFLGCSQLELNVAALLELLQIPFTGSSPLTLGLTQDKGKTKMILTSCGIPTPAYRVWQPQDDLRIDGLRFPLIVKPMLEDASLGIDNEAFVQDQEALARQIEKIHQTHKQPVLIEEYIDGRELNVSILGTDNLEVLPISEIDFSTLPPGLPKICSYAAKWEEESREYISTVPVCPAPLRPQVEKQVKEISLRAYRIMECRDYARIDIRLSPEDIPYVLEVNANPDISNDAGMPRSAKAAGLEYTELIGRIVDLAWARWKKACSIQK
jgi:D-alanine-D-alanine ligase